MSVSLIGNSLFFHLAPFDCLAECRMQKDSTDKGVGMYYFASNNTSKQYISISSFLGDSFEWFIDVDKINDYLKEIDEKLSKYKSWFNNNLSSSNKAKKFFSSKTSKVSINKMQIAGTSANRYLNFEKTKNNDSISQLVSILFSGGQDMPVSDLVIEKDVDSYNVYPRLNPEWHSNLFKEKFRQYLEYLGKAKSSILNYFSCALRIKTYLGINIYNIEDSNTIDDLWKQINSDPNNQLYTKNKNSNNSFTACLSNYSNFLKNPNSTPISEEDEGEGSEALPEAPEMDDVIVSKNLLVFGIPGCGKSFKVEHEIIPNLFGITNTDDYEIRTTFFSDYTYTDFVGQILPRIHGDDVEYEFTPGPFTIALERALDKPRKNVVLVIEELNRGNAPSIFGDIFQLLDRKTNGESEFSIINVNILDYLNRNGKDYKNIKIPSNLSIVATMNTSDQNVFTLDNAFKRRWEYEKVQNTFNEHPYKDKLVPGMLKDKITWETLINKVNSFLINNFGDVINEDKQIGVFFIKEDMLLDSTETKESQDKTKAFAYKFFEYLWDDVARLYRSKWFKAKTFDDLIEDYIKNGAGVFVDGII